jgi:hypothetical protein
MFEIESPVTPLNNHQFSRTKRPAILRPDFDPAYGALHKTRSDLSDRQVPGAVLRGEATPSAHHGSSDQISVARKFQFAERIQADLGRPDPGAKTNSFSANPNQRHNSARLTADEGRSRSSRTCGEMRWTQTAR